MNKSQIISSSINGLIAGCFSVLLILTRKHLLIPHVFLFIIQLTIMVLAISYTIKQYRKIHETHSDKIALNLGNITFVIAIAIILIFRYFNGWFTNKSMLIIIWGIAAIIIIGRLLTYLLISLIKK
jgi:hypothetical protein